MPHYTYTPKGKLASYAKFLWLSDGYTPSSQKERILPNGSSQLIINLGNKEFRHFSGDDQAVKKEYDRTVIAGIHTGHIFLDSYSRVSTMGVVLKPGAISALFGMPAVEFQNRATPLEDICEEDLSALRQQLVNAPTQQKFRLLESFLADCIDPCFIPPPAVMYAVKQIDERKGIQPVSKILANIGYSRRWFSAIYKQTVGITPKQHSRICRFQHTLQMIRKCDEPDWTNLALGCGYYDQAHFIHDFKNLSGISPTEYYRNQSNELNHLPV